MYQPATVKPARPMAVTIAAVIMGLMALLSLLAAITGLVAIGETVDEFRRLAAVEPLGPDEIDAIVGFLRVSFVCNAVVMALFAILLGVLAWGVTRGSQGARVTTWVICGLGVLCACCTGFGSLASFSNANPATSDPDQIAGNLAVRALPDWAAGVLLGSSGLNVLGYIATAILLALPSANAFFKGARPAAWTPPMYPRIHRTIHRLPRIRLTPPRPHPNHEVSHDRRPFSRRTRQPGRAGDRGDRRHRQGLCGAIGR